MTRQQLIEQLWRQVSGGYPTEDSNITPNLINQYVNQGIALAVKNNYKEAIQLDGVGYVNNSFYTSFSDLVVTQDENFVWKITLPSVPIAVGRNEGIASLKFKDEKNQVSYDAIPLSMNQRAYSPIRPMPNKILYYSEGNSAYAISTFLLDELIAKVTLISGGDSTNLSSQLNVPDDAIPTIVEYVSKMLNFELRQPQDAANDGENRV